MVYVLLANGFEEIEALTVVDVLRRAKIDVQTVDISNTGYVTGSHGITVETNNLIDDLKDDFDMIVLPGGMPGTENLYASKKVKLLVDTAVNENKYICAICAAPSIIGRYGLLREKKACCYPSHEAQLLDANVLYDDVVCDGKIITSRGAGTAHKFAFKLVEVLTDKKLSDTIKESMLF